MKPSRKSVNQQIRPVAILGGQRTPFTKSMTHYSGLKNSDLMTAVLQKMVAKFHLEGEVLGDVSLGAVMKNAEDWNMTRECVLGSGLHPRTPGYDVQRACGTGLETLWHLGMKIAMGQIESGIGGGTDTNSDILATLPHELTWNLLELQKAKGLGQKLAALTKFRIDQIKPQFPRVQEPRTGLSMGDHTELMVKEWKISRQAQDELAVLSHKNAALSYEQGLQNELVFEFHDLQRDSILRPDTTLEKLAKLKPAFDKSGAGTLTAGNSTALTDGASAVLLGSEEYAAKKGLEPLAYLVDAQVAAVDFVKGEGLLIAPTFAVAQMLKRNSLTFEDFDFFEIHEAFAGQVLCTLKAWESEEYCKSVLGLEKALGPIDRSKLNVHGGSLAFGHPFAATGGRIVAGLAQSLARKGKGRGLISICTAGGMGVVALIERP